MALSGTCVTAIKDAFPNVATWKISGVVVIAGFLIGLLYVTPVRKRKLTNNYMINRC